MRISPPILLALFTIRHSELRNAPNLALQARDNSSVSFSNWNNISALQGFDDFNGQGNFDGKISFFLIPVGFSESRIPGSKNGQTIVVKEVETKCETVKVSCI